VKGGEKSFMVGLAAICYALWRSRNSTRFGKKLFHRRRRSFALPHLLSLQVRVQGAEDRTGLEAGAEALKNAGGWGVRPRLELWVDLVALAA